MTKDTQFSKERVEMLCDGIFAIAMTLLVLELKVPELPKQATSAEIWRELGHHALTFIGFVLTFVLAGQFWMLHHVLFHYLRHCTRALAMLNLAFLMFVSLLPFSTSMFTAFGLARPVGLIFYFGNQLMLSVLLAAQWMVGRRSGLIAEADDAVKRRQFELLVCAQPIAFLLPMAMISINPRQALNSMVIGNLAIAVIVKKMSARAGKKAAAAA